MFFSSEPSPQASSSTAPNGGPDSAMQLIPSVVQSDYIDEQGRNRIQEIFSYFQISNHSRSSLLLRALKAQILLPLVFLESHRIRQSQYDQCRNWDSNVKE